MRTSTAFLRLVLTAFVLGLSLPASAETFVFPHLLEVSGRAALDRSPGSSDTIVHATLASVSGAPASGNSVRVYAYASDGSLVADALGNPLCGPCDYDMGSSSHVSMSLMEVMIAGAVSAVIALRPGYLVVETAGPDSSLIDVTIENELYLPGGNTASTLVPLRVPCGGDGSGGLSTGKRIRVVPSINESIGNPLEWPFIYDSTLSIVYTGDHPDSEPAPGATADLYLFDASTVEPLTYDTGEPICAPCTFPMGGLQAPRQHSISFEELLYGSPRGTYSLPQAKIMMVLETTGDVDAVTAQCTMNRSGSVAGDLAISIVDPRTFEAPDTATAAEVARRFAGIQSHPNPFNPSTTIRFELPQSGPVELTIYDAAGRRVRTLLHEARDAGSHDVVWRGLDDSGQPVASGVYTCRLRAGSYEETRRMTLIK